MLTDLVARDLLTAALARLVAPGATTTILGMQVDCRPDGGAMVVRDPAGHVLARLAIPSFIRTDAGEALAPPDKSSCSPAMRG